MAEPEPAICYDARMKARDELITALREALPALRDEWPIRNLSIFGSMARGSATSESDLDVLVEFDRPVSLSRFLALEAKLTGLAGRPVDLVSREALKPFIRAHVLDEAVPV